MLEFSIDLGSRRNSSPFGNLDSLKLDISDNLLSVLPENATLRSKTEFRFIYGQRHLCVGTSIGHSGKQLSETKAWIKWITTNRYIMSQELN